MYFVEVVHKHILRLGQQQQIYESPSFYFLVNGINHDISDGHDVSDGDIKSNGTYIYKANHFMK